MNNQKLVPISINVLKSGMKVDYSIFFKQNGTFVLLCRDVVLSPTYITRLRSIAQVRNIYIPEGMTERVLKESALIEEATTTIPRFEGYEDVKNDTRDLMVQVGAEGIVPVESAQMIAETIDEKINTVEAATIIESINAVRRVDEYLYTHSVNVAFLNGLLAKWMGYDEQTFGKLVETGLLHDVGKMQVPPEILNKPGALEDDEFAKMRMHSTYSYEMLKRSGAIPKEILDGVLQHHERVNGRGYPLGLKADEISLYARITAVSDVYDAMVAKRVYKEAHSPFVILSWFAQGRYSDLDIEMVNTFIQCMLAELKGKNVLLSNGAVAKVLHTSELDLEFPIVDLEGDIIHTSPELYTVAMS